MIWLTEDLPLDLADVIASLFHEPKEKSPASPKESRFRELDPHKVVQAFEELVRRRLCPQANTVGHDQELQASTWAK